MRKANYSHWENIDKLEGVLFFAQLIDEMLFDYTLDSYKPSALNSRLLCIECFETLEEIKEGFIPKKSLQSVVEELKWSLNRDVAAKSLFGVKFENYVERLKPNELKIYELENIVDLLYNSFNDRKYLASIITCLSDFVKTGSKKEKIRSLTGSFVTELINYGYNKNYIYYQNFNFFFNKQKRKQIKSEADIEDFFKIFDFQRHEFTAVFKGGMIFQNFRDTLNAFNIVVTRNYSCFSKMRDDAAFKRELKVNECFIICSKIEALDHHSARASAENVLAQVSNIFNFYHHKNKPEILDKAVVSRSSDNYVVVIDKLSKSVLRSEYEQGAMEAARSVESTLGNLHLDTESTHRFARSIDLHSAAISTTALENQLLDFWAALETLLPKIAESDKDRIVQICNRLVPFLQLNYIHKILGELHKDLNLWNEAFINSMLEKIGAGANYSALEKIAALVSLEQSKPLRQELYNELTDFPLLRNRVYSIHESLKSVDNIEKLLETHKMKIDWHLRRIYRTRGQIIHSGKYPSFISILIENLHNYLDIFLHKIIELSKSQRISSIEQGVLEIEVALEFQIRLLKKHRGEALSVDNFREAILGEKRV
ncbi:hypothetical protein [Dyadobacter luticola]|uniref:Apea-like HEPN domain-containing protein n=1 Tax=Dyadobacter luticola TaxID=1979387 RepID=A0A5R9L2F7_9BACT|nr:hypothetical protein [Dyadobacter luticola]TLV02746.1 hypothetical protein FEN17_03755 [Dyadobacter luticola]